jgi:hypothetical protein
MATISPSSIVERSFNLLIAFQYAWKLDFERQAIPRPRMRTARMVNHGDRPITV